MGVILFNAMGTYLGIHTGYSGWCYIRLCYIRDCYIRL